GSAATAGCARTDSSPSLSGAACISSTGPRPRPCRATGRPSGPVPLWQSSVGISWAAAIARVTFGVSVHYGAQPLALGLGPLLALQPLQPLLRRHRLGLVRLDRAAAGQHGQGAGGDQHPAHSAPPNTRQAATSTTAASDAGRNTFQPSRISWS